MRGLASLVGREERAQTIENVWGPQWGEYPNGTYAGPGVTNESALQLLTVYGCNRFICEGVSTLPVDSYTDRGDTKVEVPLPPFLVAPGPDLDLISWFTQVLTSVLLAGNSYCWKQYDANFRLTGLIPLDPAKVQVRRVGGRKEFLVAGMAATTLDVLHIPALMYPGSDVGMSPVEAARQTIGAGLSAEEFAARFFNQGMALAGVVEVPGMMQPEGPGSAKELAKQFARAHSGKNKAHLPAVLEGGATWKATGVTNEQAQFLETRKYTAAQIAGLMFLIDPTDMGIPVDGTSLTYANLEQRTTRRVQVTFLPWIVRVENALSSLLPEGQYVKLNVSGLLRGDTKTRYEAYKIGLDEGFVEVPEVRGWEDLPPLPAKAAAPPALVDQIEAVGQLIRAGFEPEAALAFLGLPPIKHTGLVPITVTQESP